MRSPDVAVVREGLDWKGFYVASLVCGLLYTINFYLTPLPLWPIAGHDDGHFLLQGTEIVQGNWLGPYNQMTLIKGPGFPLFLALGRISNLPFSIFLPVFQAGSFVLLSAIVGRFAGSPKLATVLLVALLTFPWIWSPPLTRILRDSIYTPQIFIFFGLSLLVLYEDVKRPYLIAALAGLALGWASITREETPWLYPAIGFMFLLAVCHARWFQRSVRGILISALIIAVGAGVVRAAASTANYFKYGAFLVTDMTESNFRRALAALFSAGAAEHLNHIALPEHTRDAIYRTSPSFATLQPFLDGENAPLKGWVHAGCDAFGGAACNDYAYPWTMWALRDAVAAGGYYSSAVTASDFYGKLADDVETACRLGELQCHYSPIAEMPPPTPGSLSRALDAAIRAVKAAALIEPGGFDRIESLGPPEVIAAAQTFLNGPFIEPARVHPGDPAAARAPTTTIFQIASTLRQADRNAFQTFWPIAAALLVVLAPTATLLAIRRKRSNCVLLIGWIFACLALSRITLLSFMSGYMYDVIQPEYLTAAPYALLVALLSFAHSIIAAARSTA